MHVYMYIDVDTFVYDMCLYIYIYTHIHRSICICRTFTFTCLFVRVGHMCTRVYRCMEAVIRALARGKILQNVCKDVRVRALGDEGPDLPDSHRHIRVVPRNLK